MSDQTPEYVEPHGNIFSHPLFVTLVVGMILLPFLTRLVLSVTVVLLALYLMQKTKPIRDIVEESMESDQSATSDRVICCVFGLFMSLQEIIENNEKTLYPEFIDKLRFRWAVFFLIFTPIAIVVTIASKGADHGSHTVARMLFPLPYVLFSASHYLAWTVAVFQFPIWAAIGFSQKKLTSFYTAVLWLVEVNMILAIFAFSV